MERRDSGETLIEILIALVIMGLALSAFLTGLAGARRSTDLFRDQANAATFVVRAAEKVKNEAYAECATYAGAVASGIVPAGWSVTTSAAYWDPDARAFSGTCSETAATEPYKKLQRITVTVTAPSGTSEQVAVVKRAS